MMPRLALVFVAGCSYFSVTTTPDKPHLALPDCSETAGLPVTDTVFASFYLTTSAAVLATDSDERAGPLLGLGLGVAFALSAWYGFSQTSQCLDARTAYRLRARAPAGHACNLEADCAQPLSCASNVCVQRPELAP